MGELVSAATPAVTTALFSTGAKCEKHLETALHAKLRKMLLSPDLEKILKTATRNLIECQRSFRQTVLLHTVLGVNFEDLHIQTNHDQALECQSSAQQKAKAKQTFVLGEHREDFHSQRNPKSYELECQRSARRSRTETRQSALPPAAPPSVARCVPREEDGMDTRSWALRSPCSGMATSKILSTSTGWSTTCGTGTSRIFTKGETPTMCSTVCRRKRPCGPGGSAGLAGHLSPGSPSYRLESTSWG